MSNILSTVTQLITGGTDGSGVIDWAGSFLSVITDNAVLTLFCIALPLVGLGIGVIKRLVSIRA